MTHTGANPWYQELLQRKGNGQRWAIFKDINVILLQIATRTAPWKPGGKRFAQPVLVVDPPRLRGNTPLVAVMEKIKRPLPPRRGKSR